MARIPESKIDEIRMAADIVEVIGGYLPLKKRGKNYQGLCPFHTEKTPSFSVSPDKQIFHCFGCGKGGNVFSFLMEHERLTFIETIKSLAERYGIILPKHDSEADSRIEKLMYANQIAAEYFQKSLSDKRYKERIETYLLTKRGLTQETIDKFQIGIAPDDWTGLIRYATSKNIKPLDLEQAGLAIKSDRTGEYFDRFRLRLMIPIFNITGKVIAFGGRALKQGERAKYMNSPETPIYNKSFVLYGMNFAKQAIRSEGSVILVEGYFDFLSLFQAGIENVAAVSGTSFTPQQAKLLARFATKANLFFDADSAGRSAALRSVENFFNAGIEPRIVTPPTGSDPDSFVREKGTEGIKELLVNSLGYLRYRFGSFDFSAMNMIEKESSAREIKSLAGKIDDPLRRQIFVSEAADLTGLAPEFFQSGKAKVETTNRPSEPTRDMNIIEMEFLSLFVTRPQLIETVWSDISPDDLHGPEHGAIYSLMMEVYRATGEINPDKMIETVKDDRQSSALAYISTLEWGEIDLSKVVREYRQTFLNRKRNKRLAQLQSDFAEAEKMGDREKALNLHQEIKFLIDKKLND